LLLVDEGRTLVVKNQRDLVFIDTAAPRIIQNLPSPLGFSVVGLAAGGGRIYATDVRDHVRVASKGEDGRYLWAEPIKLGVPNVGGYAHGAGVAVRNGELWVAVTRGNCVQRFRRENGQLEQEIAVGVAPYGLCFPQPDRCYVSNWGGDAPKEGER